MTDPNRAIPRPLVAQALGTPEEALPPGDLPLERFAARYLRFVTVSLEVDAPEGVPDAWTAALFEHLAKDDPALCLATIRAALIACDTPDEVALLAAGPLQTLAEAHGPEMIQAFEAEAAANPRFAFALSGVWTEGTGSPLFWAKVKSLATHGNLDDGDPLPA